MFQKPMSHNRTSRTVKFSCLGLFCIAAMVSGIPWSGRQCDPLRVEAANMPGSLSWGVLFALRKKSYFSGIYVGAADF